MMLISLVSNFSLLLPSDSGACMEKVRGSCWTRVYGVIGILGSWELLVPLAPFSFSSLFSVSSQSFPKLKQWKRICKLERITDTRYIFNAFQKHTRFCCLRLWFCTFSFCPHDPCTLAIKSSRLLFQKISDPKKAEPSWLFRART